MVTHGTSHLIEQALVSLDGIDEAYVHGSWAARFHGDARSSPGDVDELIVGQPDPRAANDALADPRPSSVERSTSPTSASNAGAAPRTLS